MTWQVTVGGRTREFASPLAAMRAYHLASDMGAPCIIGRDGWTAHFANGHTSRIDVETRDALALAVEAAEKEAWPTLCAQTRVCSGEGGDHDHGIVLAVDRDDGTATVAWDTCAETDHPIVLLEPEPADGACQECARLDAAEEVEP